MTTVTVTNTTNQRSDSMTFPTKADAAAFILWLRSEYTSFEVEVS